MSTDNNTAPAVIPPTPPQRLVSVDAGAWGNLTDTSRFEQLTRVANLMACASLTPSHLVNNGGPSAQANCFLVCNQAMLWQLNPFAVAQETYVVQGKLGYSGKLIAALVNKSGKLAGPLSYTFSGSGDKREITVAGVLQGESEPRVVTLTVGAAKTTNKMWTADPDQKLVYSGATKWARRHMPEVVLGLSTEDDLERMAGPDVRSPVDVLHQIAQRGRELVVPEIGMARTLAEKVAESGDDDYVPKPAPLFVEKRTMTPAELEAALANTPVRSNLFPGDDERGEDPA